MIDLKKYKEFVDGVTSTTSKMPNIFSDRIKNEKQFNYARLITAGIGLSGEIGEFNEHVKKLCFHEKPMNEEMAEKLKSELGDVMWYWMQACLALDLDPNDVIEGNFSKLKERHPNGNFNPYYSSDSVE